MCGCILGWQSVTYQFLGHCDLISESIMSGAYLIYYLREESQIWCMDASLDADMSFNLREKYQIWCMDASLDADMLRTILGHCDLNI